MIREYFDDFVEQSADNTAQADWIDLPVGSTSYHAAWAARSLNIRDSRERKIAEGMFAAYGLDVDFTDQGKRADAYFQKNGVCSEDLEHPTLATCWKLVLAVRNLGLDLLRQSLPVSMSDVVIDSEYSPPGPVLLAGKSPAIRHAST